MIVSFVHGVGTNVRGLPIHHKVLCTCDTVDEIFLEKPRPHRKNQLSVLLKRP